MAKDQHPPDITVRGGLINVPHSTDPTHPLRHQPNTPVNKKITKPKPDHQVYGGDSSTTVKQTPPPQPPTADPIKPETEGDPTNVPTPPSQSD